MLLANHSSVRQFGAAVERSIGEDQANGTYLVLAAPVALAWAQLRLSPFGCVPKKDTNISKSGRLIHDRSYTRARSTNACSTQEDIPDITFESVCRIARRIEHLAIAYPGRTIKLLKGNVKSAFRRIAVAAAVSAHFAGSHGGDMVVIDLAPPFGWTGSPAYYGIFGGAISFLVSRESPHSLDPDETDTEPFFSYVWVDEHLLVEIERKNRLGLAEAALRLSMLATLGPHAINEQKFSPWSTVLVVLGLLWDTNARTVSMPPDKVAKDGQSLQLIIFASCWRNRIAAAPLRFGTIRALLSHIQWCHQLAVGFRPRLQPQHELVLAGSAHHDTTAVRHAPDHRLLSGHLQRPAPRHLWGCGAGLLLLSPRGRIPIVARKKTRLLPASSRHSGRRRSWYKHNQLRGRYSGEHHTEAQQNRPNRAIYKTDTAQERPSARVSSIRGAAVATKCGHAQAAQGRTSMLR